MLRVVPLLLSLIGCEGGTGELFVDFQTDLAPVAEFDDVEVILYDERGALGEELRAVRHPVTPSAAYIDGVRVAELTDVEPGTYVIRIVASLGGTTVAATQSEVSLEDNRASLITLSRACAGVSCPGLGDDVGATACLGGVCADPSCHGGGADCPTECSTAADCAPEPGCGAARCERGICLYAACGGGPSDAGVDGGVDGSVDSTAADGGAGDLILHFPMDDDPAVDGATDMSGSGHDGSCVAGATTCPMMVADTAGPYWRFDGSDDAIRVAYSPALAVETITVAVWARTPVVTLADNLSLTSIPFGTDTANSWELYFKQGISDPFPIAFGVTHLDPTERATVQIDMPGEWTHYAGVYDGTLARLYVDGALAGTHGYTGTLTYDGSPLWVGSDFNRGGNVLHFEGDMDDLRIYSRPLSEAEIGALAAGR